MPVSTSVVSSGLPFVNCIVDQLCSTLPSPPTPSSTATSSSSPVTSLISPPLASSSGPLGTINGLITTVSTIPISIVGKTSFYRSGTKQPLVRAVVSAGAAVKPAAGGRLRKETKEEEDPAEPPRKKHHLLNLVSSNDSNNNNKHKNGSKVLKSSSGAIEKTIKAVTKVKQQQQFGKISDASSTAVRNGTDVSKTPAKVSSSASAATAAKKDNSKQSFVKVQLTFPSIEDEEADCDPDHCECGECETDSLFGDVGQEDYLVHDFENNNCVSSSSNSVKTEKRNQREVIESEDDWNNNDTSSSCSTTLHEDDDDIDVDDPDIFDGENDSKSPGRREVIPCIHCQGGKDHSEAENLIWPVRLDIDLIETLFQLCPGFFEDFDEVEMDPMELANTSPISVDPSQSTDTQPSSSSSASTDPASVTSSLPASTIDQTVTQDSQRTEQPEPSPPNVQVDDSPLQPSMDRNKESLKVKLLLRRPMNQLVEQGILPPPKTPAAFAGQRVRLERARMGDLLKVKIQQRPARQELVRQHILEDSNARVAPSLAEKQRMLKRARLADSLNDHLIHRPGPLELVRKNILHAPDAQIEQAIKEGVVEFKPTSEGHMPGPHVPNIYLCGEDESSSDLSSPAGTPDHSISQNSADSSSNSFTNKKEDDGSQQSVGASGLVPSSPSLGSTTSTLSPVSIAAVTPPPPPPPPPPLPSAPPILGRLQIHLQNIQAAAGAPSSGSTVVPSSVIPVTSAQLSQLVANSSTIGQPLGTCTISSQSVNSFNHSQHHSSSKSRSSKKSSKTKSQPKARTIKFHEYKGPPSAQKGGSSQSQQQQVESSYELLLQQQQLFLQWQLEWQHKYPQIILPAVSKLNPSTDAGQAKIAPSGVPVTLQSNSTSRSGTLISPAPISFTPSVTPIPISPAPPSQSKPQPIALAPASITSASTTSATTTITIPVQTPVPMQISVSDIKPKPPSMSESSSTNNITPPAPSNPNPASVTTKIKLNDWKVSDLKAELKRRNLPVSGSKPQLVERLRQADSNVQDEAVSTTTPPPKSSAEEAGSKSGQTNPVLIKTEIDENSSSNDPMDVSEPSTDVGAINNNNSTTASKTAGKQAVNRSCANSTQLISSSQAGENGINVKLTVVGNNYSHMLSAQNNKNNNDSKAKVDETLIKEQQKQIEQLQQALKNSQHQLQQMKSTQNTGGQKHRIALQQHLQQKMQQQALQAQLQKLIQLHSIQQQQQQKVIQIAQLAAPSVPVTVQAHNPQPSVIKLEDIANSQPRTEDSSKCKQGTVAAPSANVGLVTSAIQIQQPQQQQVPKIPFTIVKLATIPSKTVATATATIPTPVQEIQQQANTQIVLTHAPTVVAAATDSEKSFQVQSGGANDNDRQEGPRWSTSSEPTNSDSMDHSWLLKINEVPASEAVEQVPKNVSDFIVTYDDSAQIKNAAKDATKDSGAPKKEGVKSQMVDDVLEILIRTGELPPSAAQEPTTPGKTPQMLAYPSAPGSLGARVNAESAPATTESSSSAAVVPPPPPLPPATFAVTLPTSMTFSRNANAISAPVPPCSSSFVPLVTSASDPNSSQSPATPSILDILQESNTAPSFSCGSKITIPKRSNFYFGQHKEPLSKEAEDILKISNDLSNFGREHAENEKLAAAAAAQSRVSGLTNNTAKFHDHSTLPEVDDDSNSLSLLLGEVEKDLHLVDDMDVVLDDGSTAESHGENNGRKNGSNNAGMSVPIPMSVDGQINSSSRMKNEEDLLDELGLLHSDLDVPMPMEMDYADWLDNLLPNNSNNSVSTHVIQQNHHQHQQQTHPNQPQIHHVSGGGQHQSQDNNMAHPCSDSLGVHFVNNNGLSNENCNSFFGIPYMDFCNPVSATESNNISNQNQTSIQQRDPLLSSARTLDIFSAANADNGMNGSVVPGFGNLDGNSGIGVVADLKVSNGAPMSPMSDSLLWDFAI